MNDASQLQSRSSRPIKWFMAQIERFVPESLRSDVDKVRRAHLLIGFSLVGAPTGVIFFAIAYLNYRMTATSLSTAAATLIAALTPFILRRTGSLAVATSGLLALMAGTTIMTPALVEGTTSSILMWLGIVPLIATTLGGRRAGIAWAFVCIAVVTVLVVLDERGLLVHHELPLAVRQTAAGWNCAVFILVVLTFALLYESLWRGAIAALARTSGELEAAREQSILAERLASLGRMAAGVAHEINNPMTFISGNVELLVSDLQKGPLDPNLQREYVEDILPATEEGIKRVIGIVGDLRRFARGDAERSVEFDFNEEIRAAVRMTEKSLMDFAVEVKLGKLPPVVGLPRQITQVAMNLIINASQAVKRGGHITIETEPKENEVLFRVTDDGVGMTAEVKARLFEPFFTSKPVGIGTGLGLSVVHGIVSAHGGYILVTSEVGQGSSFEVRLPTKPRRTHQTGKFALLKSGN